MCVRVCVSCYVSFLCLVWCAFVVFLFSLLFCLALCVLRWVCLVVSPAPCRRCVCLVSVGVWGVRAYIHIHTNVLGRDPYQVPRAKAQRAKSPRTALPRDQRPSRGEGVVTGAGRQLHIRPLCIARPAFESFDEYIVVFVW